LTDLAILLLAKFHFSELCSSAFVHTVAALKLCKLAHEVSYRSTPSISPFVRLPHLLNRHQHTAFQL